MLMSDIQASIVIEKLFNVPLTKVWIALTEVDQMRVWFFDNIPTFEPVIGFQTQFSVSSENRTFTHRWKLIEVIENQKITYHWSYKEYLGEATVSFELFQQDDQTLVRLTNIGLETFPQNIPEFSRESCKAGWKHFIEDRLHNFLTTT